MNGQTLAFIVTSAVILFIVLGGFGIIASLAGQGSQPVENKPQEDDHV